MVKMFTSAKGVDDINKQVASFLNERNFKALSTSISVINLHYCVLIYLSLVYESKP